VRNPDIEACVIGALLLGGYTPDAAEALAVLSESSFTVGLYRTVFKAIKQQALQSSLIDGALIAESVGGGEWFGTIAEITRKTPSAANLRGYARVLREYEQIRTLQRMMRETLEGIESSANHQLAMNHITEFLAGISEAARPASQIEPVHINTLLENYQDVLEARVNCGDESNTIKTGIDDLDRITGGINPVDLVVVAARPGMGKTEFALRVAEGVARRKIPNTDQQRGVLVFSMEMDAQQIIERQVAAASNLPVSALRNPASLNDEGWGRIAAGLGRLVNLDVWTVDASNLTVEEIRAIAERHKRKYPHLSLIMVDYLTLIAKPKAERNDLAIGHISGSLKRMAKDLKTPVMSLSQLSREVEKRPLGQRRPTNADLRDSGSIEQDADSIIMLYREAVYNENSPAARYAEIIVTKNRFGGLGTVYQEFPNGHFTDTDQAVAEAAIRSAQAAGGQQASAGRGRGSAV